MRPYSVPVVHFDDGDTLNWCDRRLPSFPRSHPHPILLWLFPSPRVTPVKCVQRCLKGSRILWDSLENQVLKESQVILLQPG